MSVEIFALLAGAGSSVVVLAIYERLRNGNDDNKRRDKL